MVFVFPLLSLHQLGSQRRSSGASRPSLSRNSDSPGRTCSAIVSQSDEESSVTWTIDRSSNGADVDSAAQTGLLWLLDYACSTGDIKTFLRLVAHKYTEHKATHISRGEWS